MQFSNFYNLIIWADRCSIRYHACRHALCIFSLPFLGLCGLINSMFLVFNLVLVSLYIISVVLFGHIARWRGVPTVAVSVVVVSTPVVVRVIVGAC